MNLEYSNNLTKGLMINNIALKNMSNKHIYNISVGFTNKELNTEIYYKHQYNILCSTNQPFYVSELIVVQD